jgi:FkbM family methyltransferase
VKVINSEFYKEYDLAVCSQSRYVQRFADLKPKLIDKRLVLYGVGKAAPTIIDFCEQADIVIDFLCDRSPQPASYGIPYISISELIANRDNLVVIIGSYRYSDEIQEILSINGFAKEQIIPFPLEAYDIMSSKQFSRHLDGYTRAYDYFKDEKSKQVVIDRMRLYLTGRLLEKNTSSSSYFESGCVQFGNNSVIVDGGAYDGKTAIEFLKCASRIGNVKVYAFEADPENYSKTIDTVNNYPQITVPNFALWDSNVYLAWRTDTTASRIVGDQATDYQKTVRACSLDSFFLGKDDIPTHIKLDIEGAEHNAILGAAELISNYKPQLMICAYHKPEDVYDLYELILSIRDDYNFVLRHHYDGMYDTVLYGF